MPNWLQGQQGSPPVQGDLWWNSSTGQLMTWNGNSWIPLHASDAEVPPTTGLVTNDALGNKTFGQGPGYVSLVDGSPSYTPLVVGSGNMAALCYDTANHQFWVYDPNSAAWRRVATT